MALSEHNNFKRNHYIKKLVSNARAMISNQIALPLGVSKMVKIINWINQLEPLNDINLEVFTDYDSQTASLPLGTDRLAYHPDYLQRLDERLDKLTARHKNAIMHKCFEIIGKLASP